MRFVRFHSMAVYKNQLKWRARMSRNASILAGFAMLALAHLFQPVVQELLSVSEARAEVGGLNYSELRGDRDFQRAVRSIVEVCNVRGNNISC